VPPANAPQETHEFDVTNPSGQEFKFVLVGGGEYQFAADIDSGGDFSLGRFGAGIDVYDFQGGSLGVGAGVEPWKDIHNFNFDMLFNWKTGQDWSVFFGGTVQSSRESGADFGESLIYGGSGGFTVKASRDLTIGGGVAVLSQLDDNARIIPIFVLDWAITNDMSLRTTSAAAVSNRNGLELVWDVSRDWELAVGAAYEFSRFRLDDGGPVPAGVGENTSTPLWFRARYMPSKTISIDMLAGFTLGGELQMDDFNGITQVKSDYNTGFFLGAFASFRF
jgi:hypothetical protein